MESRNSNQRTKGCQVYQGKTPKKDIIISASAIAFAVIHSEYTQIDIEKPLNLKVQHPLQRSFCTRDNISRNYNFIFPVL